VSQSIRYHVEDGVRPDDNKISPHSSVTMITQLIHDLFEERHVIDRRLPSLSFEVVSYDVDVFAPVPSYFVQVFSVRERLEPQC
jgi:hypothetical protein